MPDHMTTARRPRMTCEEALAMADAILLEEVLELIGPLRRAFARLRTVWPGVARVGQLQRLEQLEARTQQLEAKVRRLEVEARR